MSPPIAVETFACPQCGAAVEFVPAESTECAHCRARVPVPRAQVRAESLRRGHARLSAEAAALAARYGRTPSALARASTIFESVWMFVLGLPIAAVFAILLSMRVLPWWASVKGVHLEDVLLPALGRERSALELQIAMVILFGFFAQGLVVAAFAARRAAGLRALQAGLAAKPPTRAGGPAACRSCGGELDVEANALAVECGYCGADNLVAIAPEWLASAQHATTTLARGMVEATRAHVGQERALRRSLFTRVVVLAIVGAFLFVLIGGVTSGRKSLEDLDVDAALYPMPWATRVVRPSFIAHHRDRIGRTGPRRLISAAPELATSPCGEGARRDQFSFGRERCDGSGCSAEWYVALHRGDAIELTALELPPRTFAALKAHRGNAKFHTDAATWGLPTGQTEWLESAPVTLTAPHSGWFAILLVAEDAAPAVDYRVCARLLRP